MSAKARRRPGTGGNPFGIPATFLAVGLGLATLLVGYGWSRGGGKNGVSDVSEPGLG